ILQNNKTMTNLNFQYHIHNTKNQSVMKNIIAIIIILAFQVSTIFSQPESHNFSFQASIRNSEGEAVINTQIPLRFYILNTSSQVLYAEQHTPTTDKLGMVSLIVGTGTVLQGTTLDNVDWSL